MTRAHRAFVAATLLAVWCGCGEVTKAPLDDDSVGGLQWGMSHDSAKARMMRIPGIVFAGDSAVPQVPSTWSYHVPDSVVVEPAFPGPASVQTFTGGRMLGRPADTWTLGFDPSGGIMMLVVKGRLPGRYTLEFERFTDELSQLYGRPNIGKGGVFGENPREALPPALFASFVARGWVDSVDQYEYEASTTLSELRVSADPKDGSRSRWVLSFTARAWMDSVEAKWQSDRRNNKDRRRVIHVSEIDSATMTPWSR